MLNIPKITEFFHKKKYNIINLKLFNILYIKLYFIFLSIINILEWLLARFIYTEIDQERMALHYNVDFGIDYYGETKKIFIVPFTGLVIILVNILIYIAIAKHKDRVFISHILFIASIISNCILLVSTALIYLVNFS